MTRFFREYQIQNNTKGFQESTNYIGFDHEEVKPLPLNAHQKLRDRQKTLYTEEQIHFKLETDREKYLSKYTIEQIEFVMNNLDLEFERNVLHYHYDDLEQYLIDRRIGKKNYTGPPILSADVIQRRNLFIQRWKNGSIPCIEYSC
jgi:hypothetical protein